MHGENVKYNHIVAGKPEGKMLNLGDGGSDGRKTLNLMKNAVFWDVAPCRSCVNRRWNVGSHKIYMATHPRRRHSL
jgi:hypothetical protein